jgi:hypothetical protein
MAMFGDPIAFPELLTIAAILGIPLVAGWLVVRGIDRRNTAAADLGRLTHEVKALAEQGALLAQELEQLVQERRGTVGVQRIDAVPLSRRPGHESVAEGDPRGC